MEYNYENFKNGKIQGILQPVMTNRWRLKFPHKDKNIEKIISIQVVRCSIDYVNDTIEIIVEQDTITPLIHEMVRSIRGELRSIYIEYLAWDEHPMAGLEYKVRLREHEFNLDYAVSAAADHRLLFDIKEFIPYEL